jgi:hypothetical protein
MVTEKLVIALTPSSLTLTQDTDGLRFAAMYVEQRKRGAPKLRFLTYGSELKHGRVIIGDKHRARIFSDAALGARKCPDCNRQQTKYAVCPCGRVASVENYVKASVAPHFTPYAHENDRWIHKSHELMPLVDAMKHQLIHGKTQPTIRFGINIEAGKFDLSDMPMLKHPVAFAKPKCGYKGKAGNVVYDFWSHPKRDAEIARVRGWHKNQRSLTHT